MNAVLLAITTLLLALMTAFTPASHHHGQTIRLEGQCTSVPRTHHDGWKWECEFQ